MDNSIDRIAAKISEFLKIDNRATALHNVSIAPWSATKPNSNQNPQYGVQAISHNPNSIQTPIQGIQSPPSAFQPNGNITKSTGQNNVQSPQNLTLGPSTISSVHPVQMDISQKQPSLSLRQTYSLVIPYRTRFASMNIKDKARVVIALKSLNRLVCESVINFLTRFTLSASENEYVKKLILKTSMDLVNVLSIRELLALVNIDKNGGSLEDQQMSIGISQILKIEKTNMIHRTVTLMQKLKTRGERYSEDEITWMERISPFSKGVFYSLCSKRLSTRHVVRKVVKAKLLTLAPNFLEVKTEENRPFGLSEGLNFLKYFEAPIGPALKVASAPIKSGNLRISPTTLKIPPTLRTETTPTAISPEHKINVPEKVVPEKSVPEKATLEKTVPEESTKALPNASVPALEKATSEILAIKSEPEVEIVGKGAEELKPGTAYVSPNPVSMQVVGETTTGSSIPPVTKSGGVNRDILAPITNVSFSDRMALFSSPNNSDSETEELSTRITLFKRFAANPQMNQGKILASG